MNVQRKHQKLEMEYEGFRYPNCYISDEEKEYIKNDVYVVKEALEFMFEQKHDSMTIGTCCMKEFKNTYDKWFRTHSRGRICFPHL